MAAVRLMERGVGQENRPHDRLPPRRHDQLARPDPDAQAIIHNNNRAGRLAQTQDAIGGGSTVSAEDVDEYLRGIEEPKRSTLEALLADDPRDRHRGGAGHLVQGPGFSRRRPDRCRLRRLQGPSQLSPLQRLGATRARERAQGLHHDQGRLAPGGGRSRRVRATRARRTDGALMEHRRRTDGAREPSGSGADLSLRPFR